MATPVQCLQQYIAEAAKDLEQASARAAERAGPPIPGDVFTFNAGEEIAIEWLCVREHADDSSLVLLVPGDDFPLVGPPDVQVSSDIAGPPLTVRCGEALWVPIDFCQLRLRVGWIPDDALRLVRHKLARLARGHIDENEESHFVDADPEYHEWRGLIAQSRERLQQRANESRPDFGLVIPFGQLTASPPAELASEPRYALAADSGNQLLNSLSQAISEVTSAARYYELAFQGEGKLIFLVSEKGVRTIWAREAEAVAPNLFSRDRNGRQQAVSWQTGPEAKLHHAEPIFPWVDGQVIVAIASAPSQVLTFQR